MHRHPLRQVLRLPQAVLKRLVTGLLQLVLLANRPARLARSGFVLPTTVLLVLVVVLTATALTYRSFTRSDIAISEREQQVIANAATPAIDRGKAKIEFLFRTDQRFPSGIPASDVLADLMLVRSNYAGYTGRVSPLAGANDPYTLPDETRVDIDGDGIADNAWMFTADIDGNGTIDAANERIVYSILVDDQGPKLGTTVKLESPPSEDKAQALVTRTGPLAVTEASPSCAGALAEGGWQLVQQANNSTLQKNFQVNAFVANNNNANRTFETLEFQQSRSAARANKWGAWFRYDLDVSPGPDFNWNGAMHTDGNFFTFAPSGNGSDKAFRSHMISSYNSCLYSQEASEISLSEVDLDDDGKATPGKSVSGKGIEFQGQAVRGNLIKDDTTSNGVTTIHVWDGRFNTPLTNLTLDSNKDSVRVNANTTDVRPSDVAVNPMALLTRDVTEHIKPNGWQRDPAWENGEFKTRQRIINDQVARPFVDDFFRADNRWGPKPRYDSRDPSLDIANQPSTVILGSDIQNLDKLTETTGGLDGYWERQANSVGMKLIVGERLELGNANGWNADPINGSTWSTAARTRGDALYPAKIWPKTTATGNTNIDTRYGRPHEYRQRKALRDNLAAVQGMVVYHYDEVGAGQFPAACMAMTAHPGTPQTIINSRTFTNYEKTAALKADFLNGQGTNGWEFQFPTAFNSETKFAAQIASNQPLGIALRNLAYFAGDPKGGAPSFPPVQDVDGATDASVHPAPYLSMWGDFSPLRRIFEDYLDKSSGAVAYADLSPADQATLHSAACTVSLLAYNVDRDRLELESTIINGSDKLQSVSQQLGASLQTMMDCLEANTVVASNPADPKDGLIASLNSFLDGYSIVSTSLRHPTLAMIPLHNSYLIAQGNSGNNNGGGNGGGNSGGGNSGGGSSGGGSNACKSGNYDATAFLTARGDLNATGKTAWTDPNPATVIPTVCPANTDKNGFQSACDSAEYFKTWTLTDWTNFINQPNVSNSLKDADKPGLIADLTDFAKRINLYYTAIRDRDLGFRQGQSTKAGIIYDATKTSYVAWDGTTGLTDPVKGFDKGNGTRVFNVGCDPNIFQELSAGGGGGADNNVMLGLMACSELNKQPVRYPSLYYLFPLENHDHDGTGYHQQPDGVTLPVATQAAEEYITDAYVQSVNATDDTSVFRIVGSDPITGINAIAAVPRSADPTTWTVPAATSTVTALNDPNAQAQAFVVATPTSRIQVPFLDKGVYNGREQLNARVLDIDIEALTTNTNTTSGGDYWLSADLDKRAEGVVYAFREDAVREDEIVRPQSSTASITTDYCQGLNTANPRRFLLETIRNCSMWVNPDPIASRNIFRDPPLANKGVSLKPVDFVADPDRRVHGFRLRTASGNPADFSGTSMDRQVGMTFVTDNSVYLQGDFNPHSTDGSVASASLLEEFTQKINGTPPIAFGKDFYEKRTTINTAAFATLANDHWRPVEILADAITILSANFKDGSVEDGFIKATPASDGGGSSSYMNQNRPRLAADQTDWVREAGTGSPVWLDRNGTYYSNIAGDIQPFYAPNDANLWTQFTNGSERRKNLQSATKSFVNATFISGLVPARPKQGYGGLHNFVRFLEDWGNKELFITGSFIQLNFSTNATGPFEHDAWQPIDQTPDGNEQLGYYNPPLRRWGYDVGLLYLPPAPAARRFIDIGTPRSEYYRELPSDDPYIVNLRCAKDGANFVYVESIRGTCPT